MDSPHPPAPPATPPPVRIDRYLDSEPALAAYHDTLRQRSIPAVALDMEGDQGNMRYVYSISIFQCFDGTETVIIDALKMGNNSALLIISISAKSRKTPFSAPTGSGGR
jgi:hypothetical protein